MNKWHIHINKPVKTGRGVTQSETSWPVLPVGAVRRGKDQEILSYTSPLPCPPADRRSTAGRANVTTSDRNNFAKLKGRSHEAWAAPGSGRITEKQRQVSQLCYLLSLCFFFLSIFFFPSRLLTRTRLEHQRGELALLKVPHFFPSVVVIKHLVLFCGVYFPWVLSFLFSFAVFFYFVHFHFRLYLAQLLSLLFFSYFFASTVFAFIH